MKLTSKNTKAELLWATESLNRRIRELEAEIAVRDNIGNEVLRILREATGRRDFHSEMEAVEWAARMILDLQTQLFLEKQSSKEAMSREAAAVSREIGLRAELTEARRDAARLAFMFDIDSDQIRWSSVPWFDEAMDHIVSLQPKTRADWNAKWLEVVRKHIDAAIDAAMKEAK